MALPIIVPEWDFELQHRDQGVRALPTKRLPTRTSKILRLVDSTSSGVRDPTERELLITRWRRIVKVNLSTVPCPEAIASTHRLFGADKESGDCGGSLLVTCEWLLRRRLRQDWELMCRADRTQALALASRFKMDSPITGDSDLAAEAAAWMLFAMYWCGTSHPAALFNKSLHPPTGLVRWISQFHVDQQSNQVRAVQEQFSHYLGVTKVRCDLLVRRMMKRTGSVALLRELCDF
jgi:hypothetical protein